MDEVRPLNFIWDGEALRPATSFIERQAQRQFVAGEVYRLGEEKERSEKSHGHQFAWLKPAWQSLPESIAHIYPSPEHLRKRALIEAGFYDEQILDAGTNAAAIRMARFIGAREEFTVAVVRGAIVMVRTAKSQKRRMMDHEEFQRSKSGMMQVISDLIGIDVETLQNAEAA